MHIQERTWLFEDQVACAAGLTWIKMTHKYAYISRDIRLFLAYRPNPKRSTSVG